MNVVPEGGMAFWWNLNQIIDGHTTIEHALPIAPLYRDVIQLFAQSGTAWTPSTHTHPRSRHTLLVSSLISFHSSNTKLSS